MRQLLPLILITLVLSGCSQKIVECEPVPCIQLYPKLPTYKTPTSNKFKTLKYNEYSRIISDKDLTEVLTNNKKLRKICSNYAVVNKRVNKEYTK